MNACAGPPALRFPKVPATAHVQGRQGFGAECWDPPARHLENPCLAAATDGMSSTVELRE